MPLTLYSTFGTRMISDHHPKMPSHRPNLPSAQGALLGALIGDAVGATLEFLGRIPTSRDIDKALTLPGGGALAVAPGQITDDGELTLALARALIGSQEYPIERVAGNYLRWISSAPFDVGNATRMAMDCDQRGQIPLHSQMRANALRHNQDSKANGALMRSSPLGIWSARLNQSEAIATALSDAGLTHPNPACQWANAAYVCALRHLMLFPGDAHGAFEAAWRVLAEDQATSAGSIEVRAWLEDAQAGRLPPCHPMAGFVRIGFTHAFFHLLEESTFENALRVTLAGGGDTDTNACIVGALAGALNGLEGIPASLIEGVLHCDTRLGHGRPSWLQAGDALELTAQLTVDIKRPAVLSD